MSVFTLGAAALALAAGAQAGDSKVYQLTDSYDSSNWFDKWTFFSNPDPTNGFVSYKSEEDAKSAGLISVQDDEVYIGVDSTTKLTATGNSGGRASVRIESKATYDKGLFIARFSHLPAAACGSWPAFWTYATPWPNAGEMDIVESWNSDAFNRPALHTGASAEVGSCSIDGTSMTAKVATPNCDNTVTNDVQVATQGCSAYDNSGVYANPKGGVYAMEWTDEYIKIWNWLHEDVPESCDSENPDPSTFGTPSFVTTSSCQIKNLFQPQTLVMNIDFCGGAPESTWANSCAASTGFSTCQAFVAAHPDAFTESYWKVTSIKAYQLGAPSGNSSTTSSISTPVTATATESKSTVTGTAAESTASATTTESTATATESNAGETMSTTAATKTSSHSAGATTTATSKPTPTENGSSGSEDDEDCDEDGDGSETATSETNAATGTALTPTQFTTSTIYTTSVYTVTSCAPTVTNCPAGSVTTEVIALTTTVCPVTATETGAIETPGTEATTGLTTTMPPASMTTSTIFVTSEYTITSCAPTVTNCPVGVVTTAVVISTTVVPCEQSGETTTSLATTDLTTTTRTTIRTMLTSTVTPSTALTTTTVPTGESKTTTSSVEKEKSISAIITTTATVVPHPSTSSGGNNFHGNSTLTTSAATSSVTSGTGVVPGCSGAKCSATPTAVFTAGAGKTFVSGALMGVIAIAAFML